MRKPKKRRKHRDQALFDRLHRDYVRRLEEQERCDALLEDHHAEWDAEQADLPAYLARAAKLFAERRFVCWRYTAADIQRAFLAVGFPNREDGEEPAKKIMLAAMLFLGRQRCPAGLSLHLSWLIPVYVKAGRYLDAWLLRHCADYIWKHPDMLNPFLHEMFLYGLGKWTEQPDRARDYWWRKRTVKGKRPGRLPPKQFGLSNN